MKTVIISFYLVTLFFSNVSGQDSLECKIHFGRKNEEAKKVFTITSKVKTNVSREYKINSILTKRNKILSPNMQIGSLKKDETFINSTWFYVLVGTAVTLGASASILKNKANNFDDLYNKKGDPNNLNSRNNYDLYSGIALGTLEVNVGFLIYKFLTD